MARLDGLGIVAVHGDYGVHNLLFDSTGRELAGVVDWESAYRGDMVEDLAWAEWIVRMHYPVAIAALDGLFTGYGAQPLWTARRGTMREGPRAVRASRKIRVDRHLARSDPNNRELERVAQRQRAGP